MVLDCERLFIAIENVGDPFYGVRGFRDAAHRLQRVPAGGVHDGGDESNPP